MQSESLKQNEQPSMQSESLKQNEQFPMQNESSKIKRTVINEKQTV